MAGEEPRTGREFLLLWNRVRQQGMIADLFGYGDVELTDFDGRFRGR
jgi:hypothetical protein